MLNVNNWNVHIRPANLMHEGGTQIKARASGSGSQHKEKDFKSVICRVALELCDGFVSE